MLKLCPLTVAISHLAIGQLSKLYPVTQTPSKMAAISGHSFNIEPYGKYVLKSSPLKPVSQYSKHVIVGL
jgi:hypothetical protein